MAGVRTAGARHALLVGAIVWASPLLFAPVTTPAEGSTAAATFDVLEITAIVLLGVAAFFLHLSGGLPGEGPDPALLRAVALSVFAVALLLGFGVLAVALLETKVSERAAVLVMTNVVALFTVIGGVLALTALRSVATRTGAPGIDHGIALAALAWVALAVVGALSAPLHDALALPLLALARASVLVAGVVVWWRLRRPRHRARVPIFEAA